MEKVPVVSIVDDDESVREATQCLVRSLGYATRTFASAEEFLGSPYVAETSCVIADVQMPKLSGLELQSRLRAEGHDTPIIFMTAFPEERIRRPRSKAERCAFSASRSMGRYWSTAL